jgi:glycosyltransferase involved in cell wall biosynthesis
MVLVIDAEAPDTTRDSGSVRMGRMLELMRELGWEVVFMPDNGRLSPVSQAYLSRLGVALVGVPGYPRLDHWLQQHGDSLHASILCRHHVAAAHIDLVRAYSNGRVIFDTVDLHHLREQRAAELRHDPRLARQAEATRVQELGLMRRSDVTLVVSETERTLLAAELPDVDVRLLSNIHDVAAGARNYAQTEGMYFIGGYSHHPNQEALQWLVDDIYPLVLRARPDIHLHLIGDMPEQEAMRFAGPGITVHGHVESIEPFLTRCRLSLAPLLSGAGVKGKINQAMSHGIPVVATPMAAEGMFLIDGLNALVAADATAFAAAIIRLYDDEPLWNQLSANGYQNIAEHFSSTAARTTLQRLLA